jgi:hypothetical protein
VLPDPPLAAVVDGKTARLIGTLKCITLRNDMANRKTAAEQWGIVIPENQSAPPLSVRFSKDDLRKLGLLAKRLKVGPSSMARLIVEKFIKEHDPDR